MVRRLADRKEAGRLLAGRLAEHAGDPGLLVLALPRGGVEVGYEIAARLGAPLDILTVRKLGLPGHQELAMGAIGPGGERVLDEGLVRTLGLPADVIDETARREQRELIRREALYRSGRPAPDLRGRHVILVDDGLATGSTMRAALKSARAGDPRRLVVAVPLAAAETVESLRGEADEVVCLLTPEPFVAVGLWYDDFTPTSDQKVMSLLDRARRPRSA
ncbi:MAG TPA: phosphoribosyltransferase [Candidatus Polarisedimenticolia bacterium]|nr:phosphoribosyltransferase [Candidatus Polarisedimenticolia bacterium]